LIKMSLKLFSFALLVVLLSVKRAEALPAEAETDYDEKAEKVDQADEKAETDYDEEAEKVDQADEKAEAIDQANEEGGQETEGRCQGPSQWTEYYCDSDKLYHGCVKAGPKGGRCWKQCSFGSDLWCYTGFESSHWFYKGLKKAASVVKIDELTDRMGRKSNHCNVDREAKEAGRICSKSRDIACLSPCYSDWMGEK